MADTQDSPAVTGSPDTPADVIAWAIRRTPDPDYAHIIIEVAHTPADRHRIAEHALSALAAAGWSVVPALDDSERFQVEEARAALARFEGQPVYGIGATLHDHGRALLDLLDKIAPKGEAGG